MSSSLSATVSVIIIWYIVITAVNDEGGEVNVAFDHEHAPTESETDTIPGVAKRFKARNQPWALVVDENYGEGSAREHAALQPRFYGMWYQPQSGGESGY